MAACSSILRPCYAFQVVRTTRLTSLRIGSYFSTSSSTQSASLVATKYNRQHHIQLLPHPHVRSFSSTHLHSSSSDDESNNEKTRILFLGTPDVAATSLKTLYEASQRPDSPYELVGVVTQPPKRRKRRGKEIASPVGLVAEELGLEVLCPEKARDKDFLDLLEEEVRPDLCVTAAYGQFLPKRFLATPKFGTLNIHPSLLPRWRGSSPVQRSLESGDNPVGVSVLFTVSKMDAGPIVSQQSHAIDANEQATTLLPTLFDIGTQALLEAIPKVIAGEITMDNAMEQDESLVVETNMIDAAEGQLFPERMSALECHNRIRGFSMWPGTFLYFQIGDDETPVKVKVVESKVLEETVDADDELTRMIVRGEKKKDGLRLICGDGSILEMNKVQPATRNVMDAKSFVNGLQGRTVVWLSGLDSDE